MAQGVGVGDAAATVVAATLTNQLRQVSGMFSSILFTYVQGTNLDENAKQWRLVADVLNDLALFIELVSPAFPGYFALCVCIASIFRSIVGVAGGATRATLTRHQAR